MKLNRSRIILLLISLWILVGCGVSDNTNTAPKAIAGVSSESVDASSDNYKVLKLDGDKNLQLKLGDEEKDVYLLFSNPTNLVHRATVKHNQKIVPVENSFQKATPSRKSLNVEHAPQFVQNFNNGKLHIKSSSLTQKQSSLSISNQVEQNITDTIGDKKTFFMNSDTRDNNVTATAREVRSNILTTKGQKSLTIWVEDDAWGNNCKKRKCVTQPMVDTLANKFLKSGLENDIYDWVTNVFGEEWGKLTPNDMISASNHISILLTDIGNDNNENGGVIGYFYSKDNYKQGSILGSNERIMFYIDSVMYANGSYDGWDENDYWAEQTFSTLAHEFQHMILFYQKNVLQRKVGISTWINEMLSESTEDLIAVNMGTSGPRNVSYSRGDSGSTDNYNGRYPIFNQNNSLSPILWDNDLAHYSTVSSFGAYLMRNYGGATLLHDMVSSNLINEEALLYAVHQHVNGKSKTFDDLIHEWGVAVLLSKRDDILADKGLLYNVGDFINSEYNNVAYHLGSINFYNYNPAPTLHTSMETIAPKSNFYYKVGENLKGDISIDVTNTEGLNVSLVVVK